MRNQCPKGEIVCPIPGNKKQPTGCRIHLSVPLLSPCVTSHFVASNTYWCIYYKENLRRARNSTDADHYSNSNIKY